MEYRLRRNHRSRSIKIEIHSSDQLIVTAPPLMPEFLIRSFVKSKTDWINKNLAKMKKQESGIPKNEVFLFDKKYQLYQDEQADKSGVFLLGEKIIVQNLSPKKKKQVVDQLERFLKNIAEKYIRQRCQILSKKMQIEYQGITLRQQKSRWGSCSSRGRLNFNWRLVHYPLEIIDYVIIHELAHRNEMNHSRDFWALVAKYDSNYQKHRKALKKKRYNQNYDFTSPR